MCQRRFSLHQAQQNPRSYGQFPHRSVVRCALNPTCSQLRQTYCLEPLPIHRMGARLDVSANGVWGGRFEKTFFDVRVFNPHAPSNKNQMPSTCYRKHEKENRGYARWSTRLLLHLFSRATGGMGREATCFYKCLASMLTQKWDHPYCTTLWRLRCRLTFSLIRSSIQALRGARSSRGQAAHPPAAIDLAITESYITPDF